ncbi:MAG: hypothetical protein ACKN97_02335 [Acidobacteriota bacterium]
MEAKRHSEFNVTSSVTDDVWHPSSGAEAYEWWYFDAMSDDGRDSVVVIFLDNFIFSPRYNAHSASSASRPKRFPALALFYYRDGRPLFRAINEFAEKDFEASTSTPQCRIGPNSFELTHEGGELRYRLSLRGLMSGGSTVNADLEWVARERTEFRPNSTPTIIGHNWNLVMPRARVTGTFEFSDREGFVFQGDGYHDHNHDRRWMPSVIKEWQWGRAHFKDSTAVVYDYLTAEGRRVSKIIRATDDALTVEDAVLKSESRRFDIFGLRHPVRAEYKTESGITVSLRSLTVADSSFFYVRRVAEMGLSIAGKECETARGLSEFLVPSPLRWRWLDRLVDMRIGRHGKGAKLK